MANGALGCDKLQRLGQSCGYGRTVYFLDDFNHDSFVVCRGDCPGGFGSGLVFDQ